MPDIRAIVAIGRRGQFGLNGGLPWEGNRGREFIADVERLWEVTRGHVILMGPRTFTSVPDFAFEQRTIVCLRSSVSPQEALAPFPDRVVYIGGGPAIFRAYAPLIRHWDINRLPYDGEADRWFDPQWVVAGG